MTANVLAKALLGDLSPVKERRKKISDETAR
jgi:hypothetical protein